MSKIVVFVFLALATLTTFGQQTETRKVGSFTGVKASAGIDVSLTKGDQESVKVEVTNGSLKDVITEVSGSYLKIGMADGRHIKISVKVYVTYVKIEKLSVSSAANIFSQDIIKCNSLEVNASSAGTIDVSVDVSDITVDASSAGDIDLKGKAKSARFECSTAGEISAYDLQAETVNAEASTGGSIKLNVVKNLTAEASTGGGVRYKGNPEKSDTQSSTGGSVKKSN
jgi:hypothetical protein